MNPTYDRFEKRQRDRGEAWGRCGGLLTATALVGVTAAMLVDRGLPVAFLVGLSVVGGLVVLTCPAWNRRIDLFSPYVVFPLFMTAYYGIGSLNVTRLRGEVRAGQTLSEAFLGVGCFLAGCLLVGLVRGLTIPRRSHPVMPGGRWQDGPVQLLSILGLAVGSGAVAGACALVGIPLLNSRLRFEIPTPLAYLAGLSWVAALLLLVHSFDARRRSRLGVMAAVLWAALLVTMLGYRSPLAVFGFSALICLYYKRRPALSRVALIVLLLISAVSGLWWVRANVLRETGDAGTVAELSERYDIPSWVIPGITVYMTCREGTALFERVLDQVPPSGALRGRLLTADLNTMLPGRQESGGYMVAKILGGTGLAGITPSILGALYLDWGRRGIVIGLFLLGALLAWLHGRWRRWPTNARLITYAVVTAYAIHWVHRGVFSPRYLFVPAIVVMAGFLLDATAGRRCPQPATRPGAR